MSGQPDTHHALHGDAVSGGLPVRLASQDVLVRGALSRLPEGRSVVRVCEWMVEPVVDTGEISLTLVLSENVSLSFLLSADDAQDLSVTLAPPELPSGAS